MPDLQANESPRDPQYCNDPIILHFIGDAIGGRTRIANTWQTKHFNFENRLYVATVEGDILKVSVGVDDFTKQNYDTRRSELLARRAKAKAKYETLQKQFDDTEAQCERALADIERVTVHEKAKQERVAASWQATVEDIRGPLDIAKSHAEAAEQEWESFKDLPANEPEVYTIDLTLVSFVF